ncbi:unnamed protein product [Enterobius vermicularis]|uniref:Transposase n=1 Tax=Enterobius vermicularis TaxID=51028 RepID=A0A0N4UWL2_ENTVE|nr:unnamed protein product [Enterobius vermicularis]
MDVYTEDLKLKPMPTNASQVTGFVVAINTEGFEHMGK